MAEGAVFVVGSLNHDVIVTSTAYPRLGETVLGTGITTAHGGKGANQAVAAARLGAATRMVGTVGDDVHGSTMVGNLTHNGVDVSSVEAVDGVGSGAALVVRTDAGENAIVVIAGANAKTNADQVESAVGTSTPADVVVTSLEIPHEAALAALRAGRRAGARTVLNAAPAGEVGTLLPDVDILVVNEHEAAVVAGVTELARDAVGPAMMELASRQAGLSIIVTLGRDGALLVDGVRAHDVAAHRVTPVDSTGAGDAFVGALAAFLAQGHPLQTAATWAGAAGAHACLAVGAQAGSPTRRDLATRFGIGISQEESA